MSTAPVRFETMTLADLPDVGAMERRNYEFPWRESIFGDCVKAGYTCLLVKHADVLVGYAILQVAADEAHILNLCIDAASQQRGYARLLLDKLLALATAAHAGMIFLEVRPSNPRAVNLYLMAGFNEIGVRRGYYDARDGREDALVMARVLLVD